MSGAYIGGTWRVGDGPAMVSTCPATGDTVWEGSEATGEQVISAVSAARSAFAGWSKLPQNDRTRILEEYAVELSKRSEQIAEAISRDMGKPLWESRVEAATMQAKVNVSISAQVERAGSKFSETAFGSSHLTHRPHGVMAVFGPFNFPGHLPNGHIIPALLAGNTCVFKPSEMAPRVAELMVEAFEAAGLPAGCLNVVQGGRDTGGALLDADVNGVLFTGSVGTGRFIHQKFGGRPEVLLALEMGGNNPLIVWNPVDVEAAADIAAQSAFLSTGQRCSCARRIILPDDAFGREVIDALIERAKGLRVGAWNEENIFMGPLVSAEAAAKAVEFQMNLSKAGGKGLRRLKRLARGDAFVSAGVIDVTDVHASYDEELFGPLAQIIRVKTLNEAIVRANDTAFGLSGGIVSDDDSHWVQAKREMRVGILNRNRPTVGASGAMPFGGPGLSGNFRPGAFYAADYSAWPQASQVADVATRMIAEGFP